MTESSWLVELSGKGRSLYVFPHAGAGASAVSDLSTKLGDAARVIAVRLPGREASAHIQCETDVDVIASAAAAQIRLDHDGSEPVILYGHCAGAIIAYEVAALLCNDMDGHLIVSSHEPPDRVPRPGVWTWPDDDFLGRVAQDGFLPPEILEDEELRDICLSPLRADYQALETHDSLCEVVSWPVTALYPNGHTPVGEGDMRAWAELSQAEFVLRHITGPHHVLTHAAESVAVEIESVMQRT